MISPRTIVKGAVHAQQELGAEIVLVGQRAAIEASPAQRTGQARDHRRQ
ncbi:MAG: hypothetical protein ACLRRN_08910 [Oscillospiraceae bacterium]